MRAKSTSRPDTIRIVYEHHFMHLASHSKNELANKRDVAYG